MVIRQAIQIRRLDEQEIARLIAEVEEGALKEWLMSAFIFFTGVGCMYAKDVDANSFSRHERMLNFEPMKVRQDEMGYKWVKGPDPALEDHEIKIIETPQPGKMCQQLFSNKEGAHGSACFYRIKDTPEGNQIREIFELEPEIKGLIVLPPHAPKWLKDHEMKHAKGWKHQ